MDIFKIILLIICSIILHLFSLGVLVMSFFGLICNAFIIESNADIFKIVFLNIVAICYLISSEIAIKNWKVVE